MSIKINKHINIIFFDIDNTLVNGYTQKYFLLFLFKRGYIGLSKIFLLYLWFFGYKIHLNKNIDPIMNYFLKFLKNFKKNQLDLIVKDFFNNSIKNRIFKEAAQIIKEHQRGGDCIVFISTVISPIAEVLAHFFHVNHVIATKLEINAGLYTGKICGKVLDGGNKLKFAKFFLESMKKEFVVRKTFFYSDHYSDIPLLNFVNEPYAVNPDDILVKAAKKNNWQVLTFNKQ